MGCRWRVEQALVGRNPEPVPAIAGDRIDLAGGQRHRNEAVLHRIVEGEATEARPHPERARSVPVESADVVVAQAVGAALAVAEGADCVPVPAQKAVLSAGPEKAGPVLRESAGDDCDGRVIVAARGLERGIGEGGERGADIGARGGAVEQNPGQTKEVTMRMGLWPGLRLRNMLYDASPRLVPPIIH